MPIFKRIELWVLLAVVGGGLIWVFTSGGNGGEDEEAASTGSAGAPLLLHRLTLKRDYGNARLDLDVRVQHRGADKLVLQSPRVKLLTGSGREVPSFFLPFEALPEVAPGSTQDVQLRYWLEARDLDGALTLEVEGQPLPVKGAQPFALDTLKNGEERTLQPGGW